MGFSLRVICAWLSVGTLVFCGASAADPPAAAPSDAAAQLFNTVVLATVHRDPAAATKAKARLVLEHSDSLYARYVVTTFAQPQDYRKLLRDQLEEHREQLTSDFAQAFCRAARQGAAWFGPPFLADDAFVLQCALAAYAANDYRFEASCRDKLNESKKAETRALAAAAFDRSLSAVQRVSQLHALKQEPAPLFKSYFLSRLSSAERELPEMLRVQVETLLEARKFSEALPLVEKLIVLQTSPQVQFWRAWSLAALHRPAEALAAIRSLQQAAPADPWTVVAGELGRSLESLEAEVAATADLLAAAAARLLREDTEGLEATISYRVQDGRTISIYVAALFAQGLFETVIQDDGRIVLAYRAAQGQGRTYCEGDATIQTFQQNATYPLLSCELTATDTAVNASWNVNTSNSAEALSQTRQRIKISPQLLTPAGLTAVLQNQLVGHGSFPAVVRDAGGSRLRLLRFQARLPELQRSEFCFAADASLTRVDLGWLSCENLRYGPSEALSLAPPAWPDLPVIDRQELDPAWMFRTLAAAMALFRPQPAAVAAAAAPELR